MKGLTRVSVASAEKNYHDGDCGDRNLEESAHLKRVVGVCFGRNSTDVLFEWPAATSTEWAVNCFARGNITCPALIRLYRVTSLFGAHLAHSLPTRVARALGSKAIREGAQIKMRVMAAAARAKISRATKARWAKFRAEKNKKAHFEESAPYLMRLS